jgi:2-polyprenyl-3-methyl-5-hydroxy-6-metoxy-1,4-benzoquinol methylase
MSETIRPVYQPKEWEEVDCPFCNSNERRLYERFGDSLQYTYVLCKGCSLIYQSPRPKYDQDFLNAAYGKYFVYDPEYEYSGRELWEFGTEVQEIIRYDTNRTALLEIGSCMGSFLKVAMPHYVTVEGLEISEDMAAFTKEKLGVRIYQEQFEDFEPDKKYSCVHMSHVIEHIPNPNEWMSKASEVLEKDGILVICIPNMHSIGREVKLFLKRIGLRKGRWKESWRTPDHLFEPTKKSMKYLCGKNGFKIVHFYTYSRKDPVSEKWLSKIMQRKLKIGSNLRYYLKKQ